MKVDGDSSAVRAYFGALKSLALPGIEWVGDSLCVQPVKALRASCAVLRPFG